MRIGRTEADEQKAVIQWCILMEKRWPELEYLYHVPNGGSRNRIEAANLKEEGVKAGVPLEDAGRAVEYEIALSC